MESATAILSTWSVGVQLATVCILAFFFILLARALHLEETRLWAAAWVADVVAIAAVMASAYLHGALLASHFMLTIYAAGKTAYAFLLVAGARRHLRPGVDIAMHPRALCGIIVVWSLLVGFLAPEVGLVRIAQFFMVGCILTWGALWILRHPRFARSRWLGWTFLTEGVLFLHYVPVLLPQMWGGRPLLGYTPYASFFDAGAELLVALASLVALESSASEHLQHLNQELLVSQERLRQLVDLDPLTALTNRRGLRAELARVRPTGAALVFIDVDRFKEINDRFGHIAGDSCLRRVSLCLSRVFRVEDALFRWGGDEFLVIAPGLDREGASQRVGSLRTLLAEVEDEAPGCSISAGIAVLEPGGDPDRALHEADEHMYAEKHHARHSSSSGISRLGEIWSKQTQ